MKYSVLLPTRNGSQFLENCIRSIIEQDYSDFELVISDNANTDNTQIITQQFLDNPRVKLIRNDEPVSVTDNWNNAYYASSGDYILMMGDDDYLLPQYFQRMDSILERHGQPDCVVYNAYSYVAPLSIDNNSHSFYGEQHFNFANDLTMERGLLEAERMSIVRDMFRFKVRLPLNMQTALIARSAAESIPGGVFQPPFPDHYALNALLLTSDKWVFSPEKFIVVGVSPKSFGHYVYSHQQGNGLAYLGISADFPGRLPGNELLNAMVVWLLRLSENYPKLLSEIRIDRASYVRRQFYAWCIQKHLGTISHSDLFQRMRLLSGRDWLGLLGTLFDMVSWKRFCRQLFALGKSSLEIQWHGLSVLPGVTTIREFGEWVMQRDQVKERVDR